jgi:hypothetical protein
VLVRGIYGINKIKIGIDGLSQERYGSYFAKSVGQVAAGYLRLWTNLILDFLRSFILYLLIHSHNSPSLGSERKGGGGEA